MSEAKLNDILESGLAHHRAGRFSEAEACYRRILRIDPEHADGRHMLGLALAAQGRIADAVAELRRAHAARPGHAGIVYNLARALQANAHWDEAAETYRRAIALRARWPAAQNNLGIVLQAKNDFAGAEAAFRATLQIQRDYAEAHYNLGNVLREQNRIGEAIECYRRALALKGDYPEALINLGNVLQRSGQLDEAIACFERSITLNPDLPKAHNSLGNAFKDAGRLDEAIESYRRSIAADGGSWAWDNLLYTLHFHPDYDAHAIAGEHARWNERFSGLRADAASSHQNTRLPDRRLNIGYVSPDLREHPVGRFMLPLLAHHDRERHRIFCYSDARCPDALSRALQSHADVWRDTDGLSDDRLAAAIREDAIDVLVDLTMHMEGNRLPAFALSPAPVQVTYLAYCSTTGLASMNYRLTDPHLDPLGQDDSVYCEKSIRLPQTYWCYQPSRHAGEVRPLPAMAAGHITFGCLNNYSKVAAPTWSAWFQLLHAVPNARLLVQSPEGRHRNAALDAASRHGLDPARLTFVGRVPMADYFKLHDQIDIALDPFPYGGGTTSCDALWMGVPVVTLAGTTAVSRGGLSILSNVGFPEWVARTPDRYVQFATDLATDLAKLAALRANLRQTMGVSALMDAGGFARNIEAAFRTMWTAWCDL